MKHCIQMMLRYLNIIEMSFATQTNAWVKKHYTFEKYVKNYEILNIFLK